jgi:hypothetical protein
MASDDGEAEAPVLAVRSSPGEYFLASEEVHLGLRFRYRDALYEVISEPRRWGLDWAATVEVIEGLRPGIQFRALLRTGHRVE